MSDYRNYIRNTAGGFDGTTPDSTAYLATRFVRTTATTTVVGRFTPASLGRDNVASIVRVALSGVLDDEDYVRVLDSSGGTRFDVEASLAGSQFFFLNPTDILAISAPLATQANILVNDLSDDQAVAYAQVEADRALGSSAPAPLVSAANPINIAGFTRGTFFLTSTAVGATAINLAPLADFGVGARIVIRNTQAANRTVNAAAGEQINGVANFAVTDGAVRSFEAAGTQWLVLT